MTIARKIIAAAALAALTISLLGAPCAAAGMKAKSRRPVPTNNPTPSGFRVTFVELGSVNCIPCRMMQPVMEEIKKEYGTQVNVVFHDVWTAAGKPYGEQYAIRAIPTQVFLDRNGKEYFRHLGFFPKEEIVKILKQQGVK